MRRVELPGAGAMILADTVGFIRHLPHGLVAAFRSTLEEVQFADLLLHVVDASHADHHAYEEQVNRVLAEIGAEDVPRLIVMNKIDATGDRPGLETDGFGQARRVFVSARTGAGLDGLLEAIHQRLGPQQIEAVIRIPLHEGRLRSRLYGAGIVLSETVEGDMLRMTLTMSREAGRWIAAEQGVEVTFVAPGEGQDKVDAGHVEA